METKTFDQALKDAFKQMQEKEKGNKDAFKNREVTVAREGKKIVLPNDPREMTYDEAIENIKRIKEQENVVTAVHEEIDSFPLEGAWALTHVLKNRYGHVLQQDATNPFTGEDVRLAGVGMKKHLELAQAKKTRPLTTAERLEHALAEIIERTTNNGSDSGYLFNDLNHVVASAEQDQILEASGEEQQELN